MKSKQESTSSESIRVEVVEALTHPYIQYEKSLTVWETAVRYRKAVLWSLLMCLTIVMDGYDGNMVPSFYALPMFQRKYGIQLPNGDWTIEAKWQTAFLVGTPIGRITGALGVGMLSDRFGRKMVTIAALVLMSGVTFIVFFATGKEMLCAGWIISGVIWGVFNTMAPTYASEMCPIKLRAFLSAAINLSWVIGQLVSTGVVTGTSTREDIWAYRIPLAVQWAFPAILVPALLFAPESPWWLLQKGRIEDARKTLTRLVDPKKVDVDLYLDYIVQTDREEVVSGSFKDCFKGSDLRRTEIGAMAFSIQVLCGANIINFFAYFFQLTGVPQDMIFKLTVGLSGLAFVSTALSSIPIARYGRRAIFLTGLTVMATVLFIMGILGCIDTKGSSWGTAILLYIWTGTYDMTVGPVAFVIVSETSSMRLRSKTVAISAITVSVFALVFNIAVPYMLNEAEADIKGKVGFVFGPLCIISLIWTYFRLPELKGLSYMEIDRLFESGIKARDFKEARSKDTYIEEY